MDREQGIARNLDLFGWGEGFLLAEHWLVDLSLSLQSIFRIFRIFAPD